MRRIDEFRLFYNHTIHPELIRMERVRKRLLLLLGVSLVAVIGFVFVLLLFKATIIGFFLVLPFGFYMFYLVYRVHEFRLQFKPKVVKLILDFIDDSVNYGTLKYKGEKKIKKEVFLASQIFKTKAPEYNGEDYISGKIGELDFELSELSVREYSKVRSRLNYVFRGIFLHATFNRKMEGDILILPQKFKQYLSKTIRSFDLRGGEEMTEEMDVEFGQYFLTYATSNADITGWLSDDMQQLIINYYKKTGKEFYISFIKNEIYIAITEPKDILEPFVFKSNVSFELIHEFVEEIDLLMNIVEDFDKTH